MENEEKVMTTKDRVLTEEEKQDLEERIAWLFEPKWLEDVSDEEEKFYEKKAKEVVELYGWEETLKTATTFIHTNTKTPEDAITYARLYWNTSWYDNYIPHPYDFFAFFFDKINFDVNRYDDTDILWGLMETNMPQHGYRNISNWNNPYYDPIEDKEVVRAVFRLRNELNIKDCIIPGVRVGSFKLGKDIDRIISKLEKKNIRFTKEQYGINTILRTDNKQLVFYFKNSKLAKIKVSNGFPGIEREGIRLGMPISEALKLDSYLEYDSDKKVWIDKYGYSLEVDEETGLIMVIRCYTHLGFIVYREFY